MPPRASTYAARGALLLAKLGRMVKIMAGGVTAGSTKASNLKLKHPPHDVCDHRRPLPVVTPKPRILRSSAPFPTRFAMKSFAYDAQLGSIPTMVQSVLNQTD